MRTNCTAANFRFTARKVRRFVVLSLLGTLILSQGNAQPRVSIEIQPHDFYGNLLKFADGSFIAEKQGELYRLEPDGKLRRRLAFDPTHPFAEITAHRTYFKELFAALADGGFFAALDFDLPYLGGIGERLGRFDRDGRLVAAYDHSGNPARVGIQLPDGRVLLGFDSVTRMMAVEDFSRSAFQGLGSNGFFSGNSVWGATRVFACQGSNVLAAGNFSLSLPATQAVALLRLKPGLFLDSSFGPPACTNVTQLAVQSDGRIILGGRLGNEQGVFESEVSVFRLNPDGSFDRRFLQASNGGVPTFAIEANDQIVILHSGRLWRFLSDGTLKETITTERTINATYGYDFEGIELLPNGSFLAHWFNNNAGGRDTGHHWEAFQPNGTIDPAFPLSVNYLRAYFFITKTSALHDYGIEMSEDLVAWDRASSYGAGVATNAACLGGIRSGPWEFRVGIEPYWTKRLFFRVTELRDF